MDDTAAQHRPIYFRAPCSHEFVLLPWHLHRTGRTNVSRGVEPETDETEADDVIRHTVERVRPGSIILLRRRFRSRGAVREALPDITRGLRARGDTVMTVAGLLSRGEPLAGRWRFHVALVELCAGQERASGARTVSAALATIV